MIKKTPQHYARALFESLKTTPPEAQDTVLEVFIREISRERKTGFLGRTLRAFEQLSLVDQGKTDIQAIVAHHHQEVQNKCKHMLEHAHISVTENSRIIDGVILKIGNDQELDNSLHARVAQLKSVLH